MPNAVPVEAPSVAPPDNGGVTPLKMPDISEFSAGPNGSNGNGSKGEASAPGAQPPAGTDNKDGTQPSGANLDVATGTGTPAETGGQPPVEAVAGQDNEAVIEIVVMSDREQRAIQNAEKFPDHPDQPSLSDVPQLLRAYAQRRTAMLGDTNTRTRGLLQIEKERVEERLDRIAKLRSKTESRAGQYERQRFLFFGKESAAVSESRRALNTTQNEIDRVEAQRRDFLKRENYREPEIAIYQATFQLEQALVNNPQTLSPEIMAQLAKAGLQITTPEQARAYVVNTTVNPRYRDYRVFETGGYTTSGTGRKGKAVNIGEGRGRVGLEAEKSERKNKLSADVGQEKAFMSARKKLRQEVTPFETSLESYKEQLQRMEEFVQDTYTPDGEAVLTQINGLNGELSLQTAIGNITLDSRLTERGIIKVDDGNKKKAEARLAKVIPQLREVIADLTDPMRRLGQCGDLARGLELAEQANVDPGTLPRGEQFQLVAAQLLLGRSPQLDLLRRPAVRVQTQAGAGGAKPPVAPGGDGEKPPGSNEPPPGVRKGPKIAEAVAKTAAGGAAPGEGTPTPTNRPAVETQLAAALRNLEITPANAEFAQLYITDLNLPDEIKIEEITGRSNITEEQARALLEAHKADQAKTAAAPAPAEATVTIGLKAAGEATGAGAGGENRVMEQIDAFHDLSQATGLEYGVLGSVNRRINEIGAQMKEWDKKDRTAAVTRMREWIKKTPAERAAEYRRLIANGTDKNNPEFEILDLMDQLSMTEPEMWKKIDEIVKSNPNILQTLTGFALLVQIAGPVLQEEEKASTAQAG